MLELKRSARREECILLSISYWFFSGEDKDFLEGIWVWPLSLFGMIYFPKNPTLLRIHYQRFDFKFDRKFWSCFTWMLHCFEVFNILKVLPVFPIHLSVLAMDFQGHLVSWVNEVKWRFPYLKQQLTSIRVFWSVFSPKFGWS